MPSDLLFEVCETKMEYVADYVQTLQGNLKAAFQLARSQQYAAAIGNRERAAEKSRRRERRQRTGLCPIYTGIGGVLSWPEAT